MIQWWMRETVRGDPKSKSLFGTTPTLTFYSHQFLHSTVQINQFDKKERLRWEVALN